MSYQASRFHGQQVTAAPDGALLSADKWAIVEDLAHAAADFGLTHRAITVLRAMLTFVPERGLSARPGKMVVFASNETLSARLGGMPESTLRRHLAALVTAGVISRTDSPNCKRYAKRLRGAIVRAFGFDLAPLAQLARQIREKSAEAQARIEEHAALRQDVLAARQALLTALDARGMEPDETQSNLLGRTRLMLRHKDNLEALRALLAEYAEAEIAKEPAEMSASHSENERHQQREIYKKNKLLPPCPQLCDFTEYLKLYPHAAQSWTELQAQTQELAPMMGITRHLYEKSCRILGEDIAPIALLCILERFDSLQNPAGFLQSLCQRHQTHSLDLACLLRNRV